MNNIITIWKLWTKFEKDETIWYEWVHNHISDGYDPITTTPTPLFDSQKGWKSGKWLATPAQLINGKVITINNLKSITGKP